MIFWGKGRRKRWRAMKRAAGQLGWQATMSLLGDTASHSMRRRFSTLLLKNGSEALARAERLARRELDRDPDNVEAAIQVATIASTRGHWREAARRWKSLLAQHPDRINREMIELARVAYLNTDDVGSVEELALSVDSAEGVYSRWCREHDSVDRQALDAVLARSQTWPARPLISILMIHRGSDAAALQAAVRSVMAQPYEHWELRIVLGPGGSSDIDSFIHEAGDARVSLWTTDGERDLSRAVAAALEQFRGEFCLLHERAVELPPHALLFMAWEIARNPDVDWIYSDFDYLDEKRLRHDPCFIGGPDLELSHILQRRAPSAFRTRLVGESAEAIAALARTEGHEFVMHLAGLVAPHRLKYIPGVLHHIRELEPRSGSVRQRSHQHDGDCTDLIRDHFARSGERVEVRELHAHHGLRIRFPLPDPAPLVSIIIPTRDGLRLLRPCIESLRERTAYPATEIIVVDNGSREPASLRYFEYLEQRSGIRVIRVAEPFNWSRLNNIAARQARGEVLCLLNNDVEAISDGWLAEMVSHAVRPEVGVVGAALWHPDGRLQHGGIEFFPGSGAASHALSGFRRPELPPRGRFVQSFQAVTGACLVVRKDLYLAVDGMDEAALPVGYSDVDFCLKMADRLGLRTIWTPFAELLHIESASRGRLTSRADRVRHIHARRVLQNRWYEHLVDDPHFRPVLSTRTTLESSYPGARSRLNRYRCSPQTRLAFIHIPKTAGVSTRRLLRQVFPPPSVLSLSARTMLRCYEGDQAALTQVRRRLGDAIALFGHFGWGFGEILQWRCVYGTILRDPVSRTISHYRHLFVQMHSPFAESVLAGKPLALLLRKGAIPGNLMLRKILGGPPEPSTWKAIDAHCPDGAGFAGFGLPDALWHRRYADLVDAPDIAPDRDVSKVDQAMRILERDFAFVGRAEALDKQLARLVIAMGAERTPALERANAAEPGARTDLRSEDRDAAETYNYLDQLLCDRIATLPGGYLFDADKLQVGGVSAAPVTGGGVQSRESSFVAEATYIPHP